LVPSVVEGDPCTRLERVGCVRSYYFRRPVDLHLIFDRTREIRFAPKLFVPNLIQLLSHLSPLQDSVLRFTILQPSWQPRCAVFLVD
jgi:hypothetical protein